MQLGISWKSPGDKAIREDDSTQQPLELSSLPSRLTALLLKEYDSIGWWASCCHRVFSSLAGSLDFASGRSWVSGSGGMSLTNISRNGFYWASSTGTECYGLLENAGEGGYGGMPQEGEGTQGKYGASKNSQFQDIPLQHITC
jgi:hypothetical protein